MTLVRIMDLVGKDIAGLKADARTRTANGSLMYEHMEADGPRIVTMKRVEIKEQRTRPHLPETKEPWLYWRFDGYSCGYSGVARSSACGHEWENLHILMETK